MRGRGVPGRVIDPEAGVFVYLDEAWPGSVVVCIGDVGTVLTVVQARGVARALGSAVGQASGGGSC